VAGAMEEFGDAQGIFRRIDNPHCFAGCRQCPYRAHCLHPQTERVYLLLKERQAACPIDQRRLAGIV